MASQQYTSLLHPWPVPHAQDHQWGGYTDLNLCPMRGSAREVLNGDNNCNYPLKKTYKLRKIYKMVTNIYNKLV